MPYAWSLSSCSDNALPPPFSISNVLFWRTKCLIPLILNGIIHSLPMRAKKLQVRDKHRHNEKEKKKARVGQPTNRR